MSDNGKKKCFVITPIGDDNTPVRRHIDGIIDAVIRPTLEKEFEVIAAHHICLPGNITKQVIEETYKSDLVIANLTYKNPNVMYELALRHCFGKPVIMIAEMDTDLPVDIFSQRTIFYKNDYQGVPELQAQLEKAVQEIGRTQRAAIGPVQEILGDLARIDEAMKGIKSQNPREAEALDLILDRFDALEQNILKNNSKSHPFAGCINRKDAEEYSVSLQKRVASSLNAVRRERAISLLELAEGLGISYSSLHKIMNGSASPRLDTVEHIAKELGIDPVDLFCGSQNTAEPYEDRRDTESDE